MITDDRLVVEVESSEGGKAVFLRTKYADETFRIIGTSIPLSVKSNHPEQLGSVIFNITGNAIGVIALVINYNTSGKNYVFPVFVSLKGSEEKPVILNKSFIPEKGRIGQVYFDGIEVIIDNEVYSSRKTSPANYKADPDILCQYLVGKIEAEKVKESSIKLAEEKNARELLAELQIQFKETLAELKLMIKERNDIKSRLEDISMKHKESQIDLLKTTRNLLVVSEERNEIHGKYSDILKKHVELFQKHEDLKKHIKTVHSNIVRMKLHSKNGFWGIKQPLVYVRTYLDKMELKNVETGKPFKSI